MAAVAQRGLPSFTTLLESTAVVLWFAVLLVACQKSEQRPDSSIVNGSIAVQNLSGVKREGSAAWQEDWLRFKLGVDKEVADNERRIGELRRKVDDLDVRSKAEYSARIDDIERKNNGFRERVNNYKNTGDEDWEQFKKSIKREMNELNSRGKNITSKSS